MLDLHRDLPAPQPGPAAQAAADWWAEFLTGACPHDCGDDSPKGGIAAALMLMIRSRLHYPPDQAHAFAHELARLFQEQLDQGRPATAWTDYGPDPLLAQAARRAGFDLDPLSLPVKSFSQIDPQTLEVTVRLGYGGQPRPLEYATDVDTPA